MLTSDILNPTQLPPVTQRGDPPLAVDSFPDGEGPPPHDLQRRRRKEEKVKKNTARQAYALIAERAQDPIAQPFKLGGDIRGVLQTGGEPLGSVDTACSVSGLSGGQEYVFAVSALSAAGEGDRSSTVAVSTSTLTPAAPQGPH